jgi:hypothetical protein
MRTVPSALRFRVLCDALDVVGNECMRRCTSREEKYQLTLGLRHRHENVVYSFGITENLQNLNDTPDICFQLGFTYVPRFAPAP